MWIKMSMGFPGGSDSKESACNTGDLGWVGKIPWRREWLPTPVILPGEFRGQNFLEFLATTVPGVTESK